VPGEKNRRGDIVNKIWKAEQAREAAELKVEDVAKLKEVLETGKFPSGASIPTGTVWAALRVIDAEAK
jgi:predicted Ser/Thr protein kinase